MTDYKIINLKTYPRIAHLEHFMTLNNPQFTITAEVDVTDFKTFCKNQNCSFYLAFLHVVSLAADSIPQIRQRIHVLTPEELKMPEHSDCLKEGPLAGLEVREYSQCPSSHTESTGDEMYCYCLLHHHMPWEEYISCATKLQQQAREKGSLEEDEDVEAFLFPTCLPWIHYTEAIHPMKDKFDCNPRLSWGKFEENFRGRLMMPLTIGVHHGLVDGLHAAKFYENVEKNMAALIDGTLKF